MSLGDVVSPARAVVLPPAVAPIVAALCYAGDPIESAGKGSIDIASEALFDEKMPLSQRIAVVGDEITRWIPTAWVTEWH